MTIVSGLLTPSGLLVGAGGAVLAGIVRAPITRAGSQAPAVVHETEDERVFRDHRPSSLDTAGGSRV